MVRIKVRRRSSRLRKKPIDARSRFLAFGIFFGVDVNPHPETPFNPPGPPSQDTHAAVGKQVTIAGNAAVPLFGQADAIARMIEFAADNPGRTDLVVKGTIAGEPRALRAAPSSSPSPVPTCWPARSSTSITANLES